MAGEGAGTVMGFGFGKGCREPFTEKAPPKEPSEGAKEEVSQARVGGGEEKGCEGGGPQGVLSDGVTLFMVGV